MFAADLHIRDLTGDNYIGDIVHMMGCEGADMLLLGGDYAESLDAAKRLFDRIDPQKFPMGIFGVPGNNDTEAFDGDKELLKKLFPGRMLINETADVRFGRHTLHIGGTDEIKYGSLPGRCLFTPDVHGYSILLSHYPCLREYPAGVTPRLMLSGHTHAGQMAFMGITGYTFGMEKDKVCAVLGMHMLKNGTQLFVSPGVGVSRLPIRIFAAPKIHLLEFI